MSRISALEEEAPESSFPPLPQCEDTAQKQAPVSRRGTSPDNKTMRNNCLLFISHLVYVYLEHPEWTVVDWNGHEKRKEKTWV